MTGLLSLFTDGVKKKSETGLFHCTSCDGGKWYVESGQCPHCEADLEKML